jgi:DNA-binding response OmpR family regulator
MAIILCIEDDGDLRADLVEELRDAGYETIEASDGEEGLAAIIESHPDLVICDICMPRLNGYELLQTLRGHHPDLAEIPLVFLSALGERDRVVAGRELGADEYLTKPVDYDLLLAAVKSRLEQMDRIKRSRQESLVKLCKAINAPNTEAPAEKASLSVVMIEDDVVDLDGVRQTLESMGHDVVRLNSRFDIFEHIDALSPDVVLISYKAISLKAEHLGKVIKMGRRVGFPTILMVPPSFARMSAGVIPGFEDTVMPSGAVESWVDEI